MSTINPVNVWASPNDNTGDLWRDWFIKLNTNIDNLNTDKVEWPASAISNNIAVFDWVTWKLIADWGIDVANVWWKTKNVTFIVTTGFVSWEVIDITTGIWATAWITTRTFWDTWDITNLWITASIFNLDASLKITDNKTIALKNTDVVWDSDTTFHFTRTLAIWEWFILEDGQVSWWGSLWDTTVNWNLTVTWTITKSWSTVWSVMTYVDQSAGSGSINLPTAVWLLNQSFTYLRTDWSANTTTLNPTWSETINNNISFTMWTLESATIISDDSNWFII